jgi:hypothetical protein
MKTLFPVNYHHVHIREHRELFGEVYESAKHLLNDAEGRWNCSVDTTYFDEKDVVDPRELQQVLAPYLYQYFPHDVDAKIVNSWLNVYNSGQHQEPHHHIQFPEFINFSGVIFLKYDASEDARFYFENMNLDHTISGYTYIFKQSPILDLDVKQGDMIVFPSFVRHGVHLQQNNTNRMTLSFNLDVKPEREMKDQTLYDELIAYSKRDQL